MSGGEEEERGRLGGLEASIREMGEVDGVWDGFVDEVGDEEDEINYMKMKTMMVWMEVMEGGRD